MLSDYHLDSVYYKTLYIVKERHSMETLAIRVLHYDIEHSET